MIAMLKALWRYRSFVFVSIRNDLFTQFARSKLGALWVLLGPLAMVAIYAFVLSNVLAAKLPGVDNAYGYAVYLMAGLLGWTLFSDTVSRGLTMFVANGELLKKVQFPRIALPVISAGSAAFNSFFLFAAILFILMLIGHGIHAAVLIVPVLMALTAVLGLAFGLVLGVLNVFIRDIGQAVPIVLQLWFWLTPIVYPLAIVPERFHGVFAYNPVFHYIQAYQAAILHGQVQMTTGLLITFGLSLALLALGAFLFRQANEEMVDAL